MGLGLGGVIYVTPMSSFATNREIELVGRFDALRTIGNRAFTNVKTGLRIEAEFPMLQYIGQDAFRCAPTGTSVYVPTSLQSH